MVRQKSWLSRMNEGENEKKEELETEAQKKSSMQSAKIMANFKDKQTKQLYEHNHSRASTCLPSTAEGHHPALVLINRKGLTCRHVCQCRIDDTADAYGLVDGKTSTIISDRIFASHEFSGGRVDEASFMQMLEDLIGKNPDLGGRSVSQEELDLLMHFVPLDKDGTVASSSSVLKSKLNVVLTLWVIAQTNRKKWLPLLSLPLHKVALLSALLELNSGEVVKTTEATWVQEKFLSIPCDPAVEESKLLLCIAYWFSSSRARPPGGLNRHQLLLRIQLESRLWAGLMKFVLWVSVFVIFAYSLIESGRLEHCRGIRGNLETQLELDKAAEVTSLKQVHSFAKEFSGNLANFVPRSQAYFHGGHVWTIQDAPKTFSAPVPIPHLMEPVPNEEDVPPVGFFIGKAFTLQAWVQFSQANMAITDWGLSLLNKALPGSDTSGEPLSCWNWRFPPSLAFGAHDYGQAQQNRVNRYEEYIRANYTPSAEAKRSVLHTLLVDQENVTFMRDFEVLATIPLPRPVSDCDSRDITLGDQGLTLASVRFFPRRLSEVEVGQIYRAGSTWKDIGNVVTPQKMMEMSEVASTHKTSLATIAKAEETTLGTQDSIWTASTLVAANVLRGQSTTPYVNGDHPVTYRSADDVLGYPYWEVYTAPVYTDRTSKNLAQGMLIPQQAAKRGFSVSAWVKHDAVSGSGYLMSLAMPLFSAADAAAGNTGSPSWVGWDNMCWSIWVGNGYTGWYSKTGVAGSRDDGPRYHVAEESTPDEWKFQGKAYRHFVFSMDPSNAAQPLRVCIDGECSGQETIDKYATLYSADKGPPAASCLQTGTAKAYPPGFMDDVVNQTRLYLNRRQIDDWHLTGYQMQVKYWDRILTDQEVKRLFNDEQDPTDSGKSMRATRGCKFPSEIQDDHTFKDSFGQSCYWYFQARRQNPAVCNDPIAKKACPMACSEFERCWGAPTQDTSSSMQIWTQQMELRTKGKHGTMCVAESTTPEREAVACALNAPNLTQCQQEKAAGKEVDCGPRDCSRFLRDSRYQDKATREGDAFRKELLACLGNTKWVPPTDGDKMIHVPCKYIITLSVPECAWDDGNLEAVTGDILASKEWSLSFWFESLSYENCAEPQMRFIDGRGSVFSYLGALTGLVEDERRQGWLGGCAKDAFVAMGHSEEPEGRRIGGATAEVTHPHSKPGTKHFVVLGRKKDGKITLSIDDGMNSEVEPNKLWSPLQGGKDFLRVINIGGDLRISPITLRPYFPQAGDIGYMRFSQQVSQEKRVGPLEPMQDQLHRNVTRNPISYSQKTMLITPPYILLHRQGAGSCKSNDWVVQTIFEHNNESQCGEPYTCPDYKPSTVYTCPNGQESSDRHFGHKPVQVSNRGKFHFEFLGTITDNAVIVREEDEEGSHELAVRKTREFVDILTSKVYIQAFFYSVEFGIMSMLTIRFDTSKGRVTSKTKIDHFVAVDDETARLCMVLFIVCIVCLLLLVLDMIRSTVKDVRAHNRDKAYTKKKIRDCVFDALLVTATFILIILQMTHILGSSQQMEEMLGELFGFDWTGGSQAPSEHTGDDEDELIGMKRLFMTMVVKVEDDLFARKTVFSEMSTVLSLVLLLRMVYTTNAHPRLELITRTMELAFSDLMHFLFLLTLVLVGFAFLGTWMFGQRREDFANPVSAIRTLIDSMLGPPGSLPVLNDSNSVVDIVYVVTFHGLCFFFLLNFVLAIIVDSYTKVMEEVRDCIVDQDVVSDCTAVFRYRWLQFQYSFPLRATISMYLEGLDVKSVTMEDLWGKLENRGEEVFSSQDAAQAFFDNYSRYDFLTEDQDTSTEPTTSDLGMISALTMHKIEMVHKELLERIPAGSLLGGTASLTSAAFADAKGDAARGEARTSLESRLATPLSK